MRPGKRLLLFIPLLLGVVLVVLLLAGVPIFGTSDPLFHGKPESQWVMGLTGLDEDQTNQWHDFGAEGIQVLIRGFDHADRPVGSSYQRIFDLLPGWISRWLPAPKRNLTAEVTRTAALRLLDYCDVSNAALPTVGRAFRDADPAVRWGAIAYLTSERQRLRRLMPDQKLALLPGLLRLTHDPKPGVRQGAIRALSHYTDCPQERSAIVSALKSCMADPDPLIGIDAASSLNWIAPDMMRETGAARLLIKNLESTNDFFANPAAWELGRARSVPDLAIPALTKSLTSSNSSIPLARASVFALTNFLGQTNLTIPALEAASSRPDVVGESAREAIEFIRSHQP